MKLKVVYCVQTWDVANVLRSLRDQRMYMVQTVKQYSYVYQVLVTYLQSSRLIWTTRGVFIIVGASLSSHFMHLQSYQQGSHASWEILESPGFLFVKFSGPGKSWKMGLVLGSPGNFSAKSWNFLGYDLRGGHYDAGTVAKICENYLRFYLYIWKNRWWPGLRIGPHSNRCLSLYINVAGVRQGPGKMLLGSLEVLEIFVTSRVRTVYRSLRCWVNRGSVLLPERRPGTCK